MGAWLEQGGVEISRRNACGGAAAVSGGREGGLESLVAAGAGRESRGEGMSKCTRGTGKVMEARANWGIETGGVGQDTGVQDTGDKTGRIKIVRENH